MAHAFSNLMFTPAVRAEQEKQGSAKAYARFLGPEANPMDRFGVDEADFISARDGFYQASVSESGWPYVQFRGGAPGFLQVLDEKTLAYADFRGNRQYVSRGNLGMDNRLSMILMDYPNRRRLKVLGKVSFVAVEDDPDLVQSLCIEGYRGRAERAVIITLQAFDWNCPQHIPQRFTAKEFAPVMETLTHENAVLAKENARLQAILAAGGQG
jgi:uncharacterized protein